MTNSEAQKLGAPPEATSSRLCRARSPTLAARTATKLQDPYRRCDDDNQPSYDSCEQESHPFGKVAVRPQERDTCPLPVLEDEDDEHNEHQQSPDDGCPETTGTRVGERGFPRGISRRLGLRFRIGLGLGLGLDRKRTRGVLLPQFRLPGVGFTHS